MCRPYKKETISPAQSILNKLSETDTVKFPFETELGDENSFWYKIKKIQYTTKTDKHYILIFDQFEELFSYPPEQIEEFSNQLSQLLYTTIPQEIKQKLIELVGPDQLDKNRLEQEILIYSEKLDITEELVRLDSHCLFFLETLSDKNEEKGKSKTKT